MARLEELVPFYRLRTTFSCGMFFQAVRPNTHANDAIIRVISYENTEFVGFAVIPNCLGHVLSSLYACGGFDLAVSSAMCFLVYAVSRGQPD